MYSAHSLSKTVRSLLLILALTLATTAIHNPLPETAMAFSRTSALTLNTGEGGLISAVIDPGGEYAYFGTYNSPGIVVKVRLSDMSRVGALTFNTGENV